MMRKLGLVAYLACLLASCSGAASTEVAPRVASAAAARYVQSGGGVRVIVFLGDSITAGTYTPGVPPWPSLIGEFGGAYIVNLGTPSITIAGAVATLVPQIPSNATDVVIYLGTNDVMQLAQGSETLLYAEQSYNGLVSGLTARGLRVYALSVRDFTLDPNWNPQGAQAFVQAAHAATTALDNYLMQLPTTASLDIRTMPDMMASSMYQDGIHPNDYGTTVFAWHINGLLGAYP